MAQEGIATLPMQDMPDQQGSQGIGAFQAQAPQQDIPEIGEKERFDAVMAALQQQNPELVAKINQVLDEANLTPEQVDALDQLIQIIERDPSRYKEVIQQMAAEGLDPTDFPPEYDQEFMTLLKMVVFGYQQREQQAAPEPVPFAMGGIADAARRLAKQGRGQDTILAHINPAEARMLKRRGGAGTINPKTGLPEFGFFSSIGKAIGGAVKGVVGAASKVLGPQLTSVVATVGGFMIGGPAGAALAQGLVTYGQGGSLKDALINAATTYVGGSYGPVAGALAGGAGTLAKGGSLKDAIKGAAISGAMSYGMQQMGTLGSQGTAPEGVDLSRTGTIDAGGNFVSNAATSNVVTPSTVTSDAVSNVLTPSNVTSDYGLKVGPAPAPSAGIGSQYGSLNYQAPNYSLNAPVTAPTSAGISNLSTSTAATPTTGGIWDSLKQGNIMDAGGKVMDWAQKNPGTATMGALALTGAAGGFKPSPAPAPGLVSRKTGSDIVSADPSKYIVQGMPGVAYNAAGNIDTSGTVYNPNPAFQSSSTVNAPQYGISTVPTQPQYGYAPVNYSFMPRTYAYGGPVEAMSLGGLAPDKMQFADPNVYPNGAPYATGGIAQYPRRMGHIEGPGTGTSDDIPAMLSDGEFVITAKAVKGIGNGSRREGAKKLYRMMHAMEKKAGGRV